MDWQISDAVDSDGWREREAEKRRETERDRETAKGSLREGERYRAGRRP